MLKRTFTFIMLSSVFTLGVIDQADARMCRNPRTGALMHCITRPYMKDISAFNPTIQGKTAIATITLKQTENGWKPIYKTGKITHTWSDDYIKQFNPTINGDLATVKVKLKETKRGWLPVEPIQ
ncbi:MAG: hypothetical protein JHC25_00700 [Thermodesulfobacterium sp.]|nr:hypothetical protein [Thermodesulfobacterium sp.]